MNERTQDDFQHERSALDAAYVQNESGRDTFIGLGHTALFAASVSFVGDVTPLAKSIWKPALIMGWAASVIGLLALTFSFEAARRAIDKRREALNELEVKVDPLPSWLNLVALWSFPTALLLLFAFITANVVTADDQPERTAPIVAAQLGASGHRPAAASTHLQLRSPDARNRSPAAAALPVASPAASSAAEEVRHQERRAAP